MIAALKRLLLVVPMMFMLAMVHTFVCFVCAGFVDLQLVMMGANKTAALVVAIVAAIGIHVFIVWNYKIRDFIDRQRQIKGDAE
jgi:hypothetical protein